MRNDAIDKDPAAQSDPRVQLAFERTSLAYERTRIAWVRAALALISFGFAFAKVLQSARAAGRDSHGDKPSRGWPRDDRHRVDKLDSRRLARATRVEGATRALPPIAGTHCRCGSSADRVARCAGLHWGVASVVTIRAGISTY
jgi:hypothetical protein